MSTYLCKHVFHAWKPPPPAIYVLFRNVLKAAHRSCLDLFYVPCRYLLRAVFIREKRKCPPCADRDYKKAGKALQCRAKPAIRCLRSRFTSNYQDKAQISLICISSVMMLNTVILSIPTWSMIIRKLYPRS